MGGRWRLDYDLVRQAYVTVARSPSHGSVLRERREADRARFPVAISDADIAMHQLRIGREIGAGARPDRAAFLDDVVPVGDALQHVDVLVDQQDRLALRLQRLDAAPDLGADRRGRALPSPRRG